MKNVFWVLLIVSSNSVGQIIAPGSITPPHEVSGKITWQGRPGQVPCGTEKVYDTTVKKNIVCSNKTQKTTHDSTYRKCSFFGLFCSNRTMKTTHDTVLYSCIEIIDTLITETTDTIWCDTVPVFPSLRPIGSGINLIWAPEGGDTISSVISIQGIYRWMDIQPTAYTWDFRQLHADLARAKQLGKPIMLQLNEPAPNWISGYVAVVGKSRGGNAYQFWDSTYIRIHLTVLQKFAAEVATDPNINMVIGIRVQPNGYNTEYIVYEPSEFEDPIPDENNKSTWISQPPGYSVNNPKFAPNRSAIYPGTVMEYYQYYMKVINNAYIQQFHPLEIKTAWRTLLLNREFPADYADSLFNLPYAMALDTRCGWNLADGTRSRYSLLKSRCRNGSAIGYWEDSQYAWEGHTWQANEYWRNMLRLDAGVSYPAVYGLHITYDSSFAFTNKYAGLYNLPKQSPGAWIIFCRNRTVENNMGYYMTLNNPEDVTYMDDFNLKAKEGAFAMKINTGKTLSLTIDNEFYKEIIGETVKVIITYFSQPGISFQFSGQGVVTGDASNTYKTVVYFTNLYQNLNIINISGTPVIHKIEIEK